MVSNNQSNRGSIIVVLMVLMGFSIIGYVISQQTHQKRILSQRQTLLEFSSQANLAAIDLVDGLIATNTLNLIDQRTGQFFFQVRPVSSYPVTLTGAFSTHATSSLNTDPTPEEPYNCENFPLPPFINNPSQVIEDNAPQDFIDLLEDITYEDYRDLVNRGLIDPMDVDGFPPHLEADLANDNCQFNNDNVNPNDHNLPYIIVDGLQADQESTLNRSGETKNPNVWGNYQEKVDLNFDPTSLAVLTAFPSDPDEFDRALDEGLGFNLRNLHNNNTKKPFGFNPRLEINITGDRLETLNSGSSAGPITPHSVLCTKRKLPVAAGDGDIAKLEYCEPGFPRQLSELRSQTESHMVTQVILEKIGGKFSDNTMKAHFIVQTDYPLRTDDGYAVKRTFQRAMIKIPAANYNNQDDSFVSNQTDIDNSKDHILGINGAGTVPMVDPSLTQGITTVTDVLGTAANQDPADNESARITQLRNNSALMTGQLDEKCESGCGHWQNFRIVRNKPSGQEYIKFCPSTDSCSACRTWCYNRTETVPDEPPIGNTKEEERAYCRHMCCVYFGADGYCRGKGCFSLDTKLTLADGSEKAFADLKKTDKLYNPVRKKAFGIREIRIGREPQHATYKIGYGEHLVHFSQLHPIPVISRSGKKQIRIAKTVSHGDQILGSDGNYHPITSIEKIPADFEMKVYNVVLDTDSEDPADHMILADGIISGDLWLQRKLGDQDNKPIPFDASLLLKPLLTKRSNPFFQGDVYSSVISSTASSAEAFTLTIAL